MILKTNSLLALLFLAAFVCAGCTGEGRPSAKHVVFVSIDTLRADRLSCYGYPRPTTPRLDQLAGQGHRFERARSVMPTTLPAHAAMFTSLYPSQLGVRANGEQLPESASTLAEDLQRAGFVCAAFVSAVPLHSSSGIDQGFSHYDQPAGAERPGDQTTERALAWLAQRDQTRFFCFVHLYDPHTWYTAPKELCAEFGAPFSKLPSEREYIADPTRWSAQTRRESEHAYDAEIAFADRQVGRLLDELERLGLAQDTLVVVTSDHGETLTELLDAAGYAFDHGEFLHERELRVPLILRLGQPGSLPPRGVHGECVSSLDLKPTILELLDVASTAPMSGRSLVDVLAGKPTQPFLSFSERRRLTRQELEHPPHAWLQGEERSLATASHVLIQASGREHQLYDLRQDPACRTNVIQDQADVAASLGAALEVWSKGLVPPGAAAGRPPATSDELLRQLRSLGYSADQPSKP